MDCRKCHLFFLGRCPSRFLMGEESGLRTKKANKTAESVIAAPSPIAMPYLSVLGKTTHRVNSRIGPKSYVG